MIKTPTTLVLGAGASLPYGFPLAEELMLNVTSLRGDGVETVAYAAGVERRHVEKFCDVLARSDAPSVDDFLEKNMELSKIGRAAMAYELIGCCKGADISFKDYSRSLKDQGRWYRKLWARLTEGASSPKQFHSNQLSVVTFNYDLSLEAYLFERIQNLYQLNAEAALELLIHTIPIEHTYGALSRVDIDTLSWDWGSQRRDETMLRQALNNMLIVPDIEADKTPSLIRARELLRKSQRVASIGFSFGEANVNRLHYVPAEKGTGSGTTIELCVLGMRKGQIERAVQLVRARWSCKYNKVDPVGELDGVKNGVDFLNEIYPLV